jgi:hypothetical protein
MLLLLITVIFLSACQNNPGSKAENESLGSNEADIVVDTIPDSTAVTTNTTGSDDKKTTIYFPKDSYNFGEIKEGDVVSHIFSFTNSGDEPLFITSARGSCGCTVPEYSKKAIPPGEKGQIKVSFNSEGKEGPNTKGIFIEANTEPEMTILKISADVLAKNKKKEVKEIEDVQPTKEEKEKIKQQQDKKM